MVFPIGHVENRIFRQPWVTYGIMGLCVLLFLLTHFTGQRRLGWDSLQQAIEYYGQHSYLKLDPRLQAILRAEGREEVALAPADIKTPDLKFVNLEQAELDGLTKAGFDTLAELPQRTFGLVPAHFSSLGLVTHMFMHAGFLQLLGSLFFLYLSAPFLEEVWGGPFFFGFYVLAGMVSGTFFTLRYSGLDLPLVGASGAISGVIGAFLVRHWHRKIRFLYWFGFARRGTFSAPAWVLLPLYSLYELGSAYSTDVLAPGTGGAGVVCWAHGSGFGFGVVAAAAVWWFRVEGRYLEPPTDARPAVVDNSGFERASELRSQGKNEEAWTVLLQEVRRNQGNSDRVLLLWDWAKEDGHTAAAAPFLVRNIRDEAQKGDPVQAYLHWREVRQRAPDVAIPLVLETRLAEVLAAASLLPEAREVVANASGLMTAETPEGTRQRLARVLAEVTASPGAAPAKRPRSAVSAPGGGSGSIPSKETDRRAGTVPPKLSVATAVPLSLQDGILVIQLEGNGRRSLPLDRIQALAAGAVGGDEECLLLDLVMAPEDGSVADVRVVRLDGRRFDARKLIPSDGERRDAFLSLAGALLVGSGALWLFGESATHLAGFRSVADYEAAFRRALGR